jgi:hypothetical protein
MKCKINTLKLQLSHELLDKSIEEFYKIAHIEKVNRQLQSIRLCDILALPTIKYELEDNGGVANG